MLRDLLHRLGALRRERDGAGFGIVGVAPHLALEPCVQFALLADAQLLKWLAEITLRPHRAQCQRFAMQPVGRPVRRDIAAVTPYRSQLLAAGGKPGFLAALNLSF